MAKRENSVQLPVNVTSLDKEEFDLRDIFRVLRRRLGIIIGTVVVLTSLACLFALNLTPMYTAVSTIVLEPRETLIINFEDPRQQNAPKDSEMINTHVKVMTSNSFVHQIIEKLALLNNSEFNIALQDASQPDSSGNEFALGDFGTWASRVLSWTMLQLGATGLAGEPSSSMSNDPVAAGEHQGVLQDGPVAIGGSRENEGGRARTATYGGHRTAGTAAEQGQGQAEDERLTGLDEATASSRFWMPDRSDGANFEPAGRGRSIGEGARLAVQIDPRDPGMAIVEADDIPVASGIAPSANFVPDHRIGVEPGVPHGEEASKRGPAKSPPEEESGAQAELDESVRDALMAAATEIFLEQLAVGQSGDSYAISVAFTSVDPLTAAQISNTMADLYVEHQLEKKQSAINGALDWLAERLDELRAQLVEAQKAAEAYREQNELLASGRGVAFSDQELSALSQELIGARAERVAAESRLRRIQELRHDGQSLDAVPDIMLSPVIANLRQAEMELLREEAQLRQEYGPRHPKIIQVEADKEKLSARIDAEVQHVIGAIANDIATTQAREETLQEKLEEAKGGLMQDNRAEIQLRLLEREAESTRRMYERFLDRFKELHEQRELLQPGVQVISKAAVPAEPSFPQVKLMAGAGFMGSLMFATLLAFVVDRLDRGLRTGRQAEAVLEIPNIGLIPKVGRALRGRGPHFYVANKPTSAYAEAVRAVQTALYFSNVDQPPQVILVTSSLPAEGKTTFALSLSALLGASGYRTAAIDLDLRAPALGRRLSKAESGDLTDYMKGHKALDQILHEVEEVDNLHIIPSRRLAGNPTDLLVSRRMADLMAELRARYRYIVLDSPPLLGMSDSRFAAHLADAVVFVVRWRKTDEEVAQKALAILRNSGALVAGAVLTQVDVRRHRKFSPADVAHYRGRYKKYYVN